MHQAVRLFHTAMALFNVGKTFALGEFLWADY